MHHLNFPQLSKHNVKWQQKKTNNLQNDVLTRFGIPGI